MRLTDHRPDAVIVGAGIAGSALAIALARSGHSVTLLEKSTVHVDRVRGEFIVPWGVAEARALGILDLLESAGANYTVRSVPYGEGLSLDEARSFTVHMGRMVPGVQGALNLGHPRICDILNAAAIDAGATLLRPEDEQTIGVDGDVGFYIFPQGGGRVRLYAAHGLDQRNRFTGDGAITRFLQAFDRRSLPCGRALAEAEPAGPCHGYPNNDVWIDSPVAPGIVLIGDAAGHNDPSGGQGISIALNDARLVSEALAASRVWSPGIFADYVTKRREQMDRLRFATRLLAIFRMEFTEEARLRRRRGRERMAVEPELALPFVAMQKGPFAVPDAAFSQAVWDRLLGND